MEKLFVYGTLKDAEVQKQVFGRVAGGVRDALEGYKKSEIIIDGETYPVIAPDGGSVVEGMVIEISQEELKLTDEYETSAYKRIEVSLVSRTRAWVYVKK